MKAGQLLDRAEKGLLVWTILGLALIGCIQVFTRYVLNYSFTWYEELGRYLGVFITFLGAAIGVKSSSHFAMDLFVRRLKHPWQQVLRIVTALLSAGFCLLVAWYSWKIVIRMCGYGTTSPAMGMPMYIAYLPIPFFSVIMALRYCWIGVVAGRELGCGGDSEGAA
jgi:C4-dicarboxylate transporter DctQ subunit